MIQRLYNARHYLCLVVLVFNQGRAVAGPHTPCADSVVSETTQALFNELRRAHQKAQLDAISARAETELKAAQNSIDKACLAYTAGSAAFVASAHRTGRHMRAMRAVRFFLLAQGLRPQSMNGIQARARLRTAWLRLGKQTDWLNGRNIVSITLPKMPVGSHLLLKPMNAVAERICQGKPHCTTVIKIPGQDPMATEIQIRPGAYLVGHQTECGERYNKTPTLISPGDKIDKPESPPCPVSLEITTPGLDPKEVTVDSMDGQRLEGREFTTAYGRVRVRAPGYQTKVISVGAKKNVKVALKRCTVALDIQAVPTHAKLLGQLEGPWGRRQISASSPGHESVTRTIDVPRPAECLSDKRHQVAIVLPRHVVIQAVNAESEAVSIDRLVLDGKSVNVLGFAVEPGHYTYAALHSKLGSKTGAFHLAACLEQPCPPAVLKVEFGTRNKAQSAGLAKSAPRYFYLGGGLALAAGLVVGGFAIQADGRLAGYTSKRDEGISIKELTDERDRFALAADTLFLSSGLSFLTGWLWSQFEAGQ
ncbi:MAG: hypothetical protein VYA30_08140 [Myxococcota bacterium]|nr:hypothetical protein [Myxococcota bacterium]